MGTSYGKQLLLNKWGNGEVIVEETDEENSFKFGSENTSEKLFRQDNDRTLGRTRGTMLD